VNGGTQGELFRINNGYPGRTYIDEKYEPITYNISLQKNEMKNNIGLNWIASIELHQLKSQTFQIVYSAVKIYS